MPLKSCLVFQLQQASGPSSASAQLTEPADKQGGNGDITLGNGPRLHTGCIWFMLLWLWRPQGLWSWTLKTEPTLRHKSLQIKRRCNYTHHGCLLVATVWLWQTWQGIGVKQLLIVLLPLKLLVLAPLLLLGLLTYSDTPQSLILKQCLQALGGLIHNHLHFNEEFWRGWQ